MNDLIGFLIGFLWVSSIAAAYQKGRTDGFVKDALPKLERLTKLLEDMQLSGTGKLSTQMRTMQVVLHDIYTQVHKITH